MNTYFLAAGLLTLIIGLVHSVLGEWLVFHRMRKGGFIPTNGGQVLRERHVRILWASWHVVTVLGCGIAAMLIWLAQPAQAPLAQSIVTQASIWALAASAALVLIGTKARHPGWLGLLAAAALTLAGMTV
ncbi:MAG: hypothetical protein ACOVOD_15335 [Rhodoferax sp.]|jgi:hypothetical protein